MEIGSFIFLMIIVTLVTLSNIQKKKIEEANRKKSVQQDNDLVLPEPDEPLFIPNENSYSTSEHKTIHTTVPAPKKKERKTIRPHIADKSVGTSTTNTERSTILTPEEARKAFIYSEIFNRKY